ncbi:hypothetical protein N7454_010786 [Penicillium verhagenii]|nr:hypothetical protein N7454_010786 [Penicillium verhagenii]
MDDMNIFTCSGPSGSNGKKQMLLNAFDMSTVGHLSPGQWKNPKDKSATKRKLDYWIELAKLLERGGINILMPYSSPTRRGRMTSTRAVQMSACGELLTNLRDGCSDKKPCFRHNGFNLRILYKLWEGSWAPDALSPNPYTDSYINPEKIRTIHHRGKYFLDARHIVDPSPQRTPFLFQAGTSPAGAKFSSTHAEAIFVSSHSPEILRPKIENIRKQAAKLGRDPQSITFFGTFTPIVGRTHEDAQEKYEELKKHYASVIGGLVLFSGWTGIDTSKIPLDQEIKPADSLEAVTGGWKNHQSPRLVTQNKQRSSTLDASHRHRESCYWWPWAVGHWQSANCSG